MRITIDIDERAIPPRSAPNCREDHWSVERIVTAVAQAQYALDAAPVQIGGVVVARWSIDRSVKWQAGITATMEHQEPGFEPMENWDSLAGAANALQEAGWVAVCFKDHNPVFAKPGRPLERRVIKRLTDDHYQITKEP